MEDTKAVVTALENISDYEGVLGVMNWTGKEKYGIAHQLDSPFYIARVEGGSEVIVATLHHIRLQVKQVCRAVVTSCGTCEERPAT